MNELRNQNSRFREASLAFFLNFALAFAVFIPFIISKGGILTLIADFNKQQIPFGIYANQKIKTGDFYWAWSADLGSNFIGAFSFYNLGSPFFWLSLLFPAALYPYLIGPLLMLKYAVAGLTSQLYIKRFVKYPSSALLGSLLYAWSGFQMTNLQFNHFHDVVAFFPLFLLALEELAVEGKRGRFALMTALMACINYFFFIGQAVFAILYYCFRFANKRHRRNGDGFWRLGAGLLWEGVLGLMLAAWIFLPSALFVKGNPRSGLSAFDFDFVFHNARRYLMLLRAALFPSDPMGMNSALYGAEYSSSGFYLPLFGITAVYIYLRRCRGPLQRLFLCLIALALFPLSNSIFFAFNATYYARWLYMPTLMAALITVLFLERGVFDRDKSVLNRASLHSDEMRIRFDRYDLLVPGLATLFFSLLIFFWPESISGKLLYLPDYWFMNVVLAAAAYALTVILCVKTSGAVKSAAAEVKRRKRLIALAIVFTMILAGLNTLELVYRMQRSESFDRPESIQAKLYQAGEAIAKEMPRDHIYRIYHERVNWNISFTADLAPVNSFISTISPSIFKFYDSLGYQRFVYTEMPESYNGLLDFLSVEFIFDDKLRDDLEMFYEFKSKAGSVYVYRRDEADRLPFGFTMDRYLGMDEFLMVDQALRHKLLIEAVILDQETIDKLEAGDTAFVLTALSESDIRGLLDGSIEDARDKRQRNAPLTAIRHNRGFSLSYELDKPVYAYFTVPYDEGWSVTVNGEEKEIIEANGFMLLFLDAGSNLVEFRYRIPGMKIGSGISFSAWIVLFFYMKFRTDGHKALASESL